MPWLLESADWPLSLALGCTIAWCTVILLWYQRTQATRLALHDRRVQRALDNQYQQLSAWQSLLHHIQPAAMLPNARGWSASPDLLTLLCMDLGRRGPATVLEIGSGLSTVVLAGALRRAGGGKIVSLEHDASMAERSRDWLREQGLDDIAQVVLAPLAQQTIEGESWLWYDLEKVELPDPIDVLFVDGPPASLQSQSRYPALPILRERLSDGATVVLDDGARPDETAVARRWQREFPELSCTEHSELEKGAFVFRAPDDRPSSGSA